MVSVGGARVGGNAQCAVDNIGAARDGYGALAAAVRSLGAGFDWEIHFLYMHPQYVQNQGLADCNHAVICKNAHIVLN
jgi:hypothetical protein